MAELNPPYARTAPDTWLARRLVGQSKRRQHTRAQASSALAAMKILSVIEGLELSSLASMHSFPKSRYAGDLGKEYHDEHGRWSRCSFELKTEPLNRIGPEVAWNESTIPYEEAVANGIPSVACRRKRVSIVLKNGHTRQLHQHPSKLTPTWNRSQRQSTRRASSNGSRRPAGAVGPIRLGRLRLEWPVARLNPCRRCKFEYY